MIGMNSYYVAISYSESKYAPSKVYRCYVNAEDGKAARKGALLLAHAEGCKNCRVNIVRKA